MVEEKIKPDTNRNSAKSSFAGEKAVPKTLNDIASDAEARIETRISELDRVLGGGVVKGSLVLVGGDPGIGKSTLLLQMCETLKTSGCILYVSAEESDKQIKMRAERLAVRNPRLLLLAETDLDGVCDAIHSHKPDVVIIDSVQTVYSGGISSAAGSVSQVREVTATLMSVAKGSGTAVFIVGHVTKEGAIAGPKVLEHMVDCVLYFEGERHQFHRILRAVKNRFGSTNEIGVFEMTDTGLQEVRNPSLMLLSGRPENVSGSCVICTLEGTRPMLAEVQALVSKSNFPAPRRMSTGIDYNRVCLLMAVLEKRVGFNLSTQDAYVNVIGGIKIDEPAADLGVALAIASGYKDVTIPNNVLAIGEVGLTGEIRAVNSIGKRIAEGAKLGFGIILVPSGNTKGVTAPENVKLHHVANLREALNIF
jgi:DNA repair protein RadA/Sms